MKGSGQRKCPKIWSRDSPAIQMVRFNIYHLGHYFNGKKRPTDTLNVRAAIQRPVVLKIILST